MSINTMGHSSWATARSLLAAIAITGAFLMIGNAADAAPLSAARSAVVQSEQGSDVTLVRDGCGRGMRFSNSRQACVEDFQGGPPVVYQQPVGCPLGTRFTTACGGPLPPIPPRVTVSPSARLLGHRTQ